MRWSQNEVYYLAVHAGDGAAAVARHLGRSIRSIQCQANRYGISLRRANECPRCAKVSTRPLNPITGWCRSCSVDASRERAERKGELYKQQMAEEEERLKSAKRKRQAVYASNTRRRQELCNLRELRELYEKSEKGEGNEPKK